MSLTHLHEYVKQHWQQLSRTWSQSGTEWEDTVKQEFEVQYWLAINSTIPGYLSSLGDLADTIRKAHNSIE